MTALPETTHRDERLDLLDPLIYADAFDCAATLDELWRYGPVEIGRDALARQLRDPSLEGLVVERGGLYCLGDRRALVERRRERIDRARALRRRARRVARIVRHAPFVRGLVLTGSVAAGDAGSDSDVDLLVVVAPGRLATAFLLLGSASRVLGRRLFCPNYYVCARHLGFGPGSLYLARELAQARSLVGSPRALLDANPWVADVFPNADAGRNPERPLRPGRRVQRLLEALLRGALGDRLERWARGVAASRLRVHHREFGRDVPDAVWADLRAGRALRFHGRAVDEDVLARYAARRAEVAALLEAR